MALEFTERSVAPDVVVLEMKGRLNSGNRLSDAEYAARKIISAGTKKLVVDISGVEYLDSAALGMLVAVTGEIAENGGLAYVAGPTPRVSEIFRICQVQVVLNIKDTLETALSDFAAA